MQRAKGLIAVVGVLALGMAAAVWWRFSGDAGRTAGVDDVEAATMPLAGVVPESPGTSGAVRADTAVDVRTYAEEIRDRVASASKQIDIPPPAAMRSPSGEKDALQCETSDNHCDAYSPLTARSWEEAQWMRKHGFVDAAQLAAAGAWTDAELDARMRGGSAVAVAELASRFLSAGQEVEAKQVLMDAVKNGNIYAAHRLAAIDEGRSFGFNRRPGLEWLFIARRMGDTATNMTHIVSRYQQVQPGEIDHSMLVADRYFEILGLGVRRVERRPDR